MSALDSIKNTYFRVVAKYRERDGAEEALLGSLFRREGPAKAEKCCLPEPVMFVLGQNLRWYIMQIRLSSGERNRDF